MGGVRAEGGEDVDVGFWRMRAEMFDD